MEPCRNRTDQDGFVFSQTLDPYWWRLTSYSRLHLLFQPPRWLAVWILSLIGRMHAWTKKMANGKLKSAADWALRRSLGRKDWAVLAPPLQVCLDREVVQDSDWPDKFCHCQDMRRGNKARWGEVRGCGLMHPTAGNPADSRFGPVARIACASQSRLLHSSENTPPTHSMGPIHLLAPPLLSVGGVARSLFCWPFRRRSHTLRSAL